MSPSFARSVVGAALLALPLGLGGCAGLPGGSAGAPNVNGDTAIATAFSAPPGSNDDFVINVGRRVYFTENSAELSSTSKVTLDKQATWLATYPDYKIKIEGFADEKGGPEVNKALGLKRAANMAAYLESKGVAEARVRTKSFGNDRLVKKCDDISCWSQNRRGVTVLDTEVGT